MPRLSLSLLSKAAAYSSNNYFNFPKKYVERQLRLGEVYGHHQPFPNERPPRLRVFGEERPWTTEWSRENYPDEGMVPGEGQHHHYERAYEQLPAVEPVAEPIIFVGDRVEVRVGKDKGKYGIVRQLIEERNWAYVEGVNAEYEYDDEKNGRVSKKERPLLTTTQIKLVDPVDERGCDVEWRYTEDGDRVRVSTRSGRVIPVAEMSKKTKDFATPESYKSGDRDTEPATVEAVTYEPKLKTVEQDILDELGVIETKKRGETYWY